MLEQTKKEEIKEEIIEQPKGRLIFILLAFSIFAVSVFGLIWLFAYSPSSPIGAGWFLFSFAAGLSMIVLPCTLPLAFVIVPLAMGKGYKKGLGVALTFGIGVSITLSLYGLLTAVVGNFAITSLGLQFEAVKNWLYTIAGIFVVIFALTEIGITKWRLPSYMGAAPGFIQRQGDYLKALLLGLFLGNIGIGCPSPATYVLLSRIATAGDVFYGWLLFFVHAVGRVTPLIFLAILGMIGINATCHLIAHKDKVERAMGWVLIFVGGFILTLGLFGHDWYVYSGIHVGFERILGEAYWHGILEGRLGVVTPHTHGVPQGPWLPYGSWVMVGVWSTILIWYLINEKSRIKALIDPELSQEKKVFRMKKWFIITLAILLALTFGWALPHNFVYHSGQQLDMHEEGRANGDLKSQKEMAGVEAVLETAPAKPQAKKLTRLVFRLMDAGNNPLSDIAVSHEKLLHLLIVSEDFSVFSHVHPNEIGKAVFMGEYIFPDDGKYFLILDFKYKDTEASKKLEVVVGEPAKVSFVKDLSTDKKFSNYNVKLNSSKPEIIAGTETHFKYIIGKDGKLITDLKPYLAAPMHIAVFSIDFNYFLHTHGEIPGTKHETYLPTGDLPKGDNMRYNLGYDFSRLIKQVLAHEEAETKMPSQSPAQEIQDKLPEAFGPEIEAHITFPWPGFYKIFGEFAHDGKTVVTDFMVEVMPGENNTVSAPSGH